MGLLQFFDLGTGGLRNVIGRDDVSKDVATADHLSDKEPGENLKSHPAKWKKRTNLEKNGTVDQSLADRQLGVGLGLDSFDNLSKIGLDGWPVGLLGRSQLVLPDSLQNGETTGELCLKMGVLPMTH